MRTTIVLIFFLLLVSLITGIISRAIIRKQKFIGHPPIPTPYFILAKMLVLVNLIFLLFKGLNMNLSGIFVPDGLTDTIALTFLIIGTIFVFVSSIQLNNDLIFGLSSSAKHQLQTKGVFSISRHPFYFGFLFILFSSCLFNPHVLNIISFIGVWIFHHFIMIKEEEFLGSQYGKEYRLYAKKVKRYITF